VRSGWTSSAFAFAGELGSILAAFCTTVGPVLAIVGALLLALAKQPCIQYSDEQ
jgi:hypothetical protein